METDSITQPHQHHHVPACREVRAAAVTAVGQLAERPAHLAVFAAQPSTSAALQECVAALGDALLDSAHAVCQAACSAVRCASELVLACAQKGRREPGSPAGGGCRAGLSEAAVHALGDLALRAVAWHGPGGCGASSMSAEAGRAS